MKIKVKVKDCDTSLLPTQIEVGDWIDLKVAEEARLLCPTARMYGNDVSMYNYKLNLGVAMQLPKGYEAIIAPRYSAFKRYGVILTGPIGIINNTHRGDNDYWHVCVLATRNATINKYDRLFQFRIQLSQKATILQRIKWLFSKGKIYFDVVDTFNEKDRGGFVTTGV